MSRHLVWRRPPTPGCGAMSQSRLPFLPWTGSWIASSMNRGEEERLGRLLRSVSAMDH